jgi:hypothetical protein
MGLGFTKNEKGVLGLKADPPLPEVRAEISRLAFSQKIILGTYIHMFRLTRVSKSRNIFRHVF